MKFPPHGSSPESRGSGTRSGSAVLNDVLGATGRPHDERYVCAGCVAAAIVSLSRRDGDDLVGRGERRGRRGDDSQRTSLPATGRRYVAPFRDVLNN